MIPEVIEMDAMIYEISEADDIYKPSLFWKNLCRLNLEQLNRRGYQDFKRTVNQNYFNWLPTKWGDNQFQNVRHHLRKKTVLHPFLLRFLPPKDLEAFEQKGLLSKWTERFCYKLFVGMLWEYVRTKDSERLLDRLEEPSLGSPLEIMRYGRRISQDIANSVLERSTIMQFAGSSKHTKLSVAELGAGYGRLAYVFLKAAPCRYIIIDIPPALHLSQWYLSNLFPKSRIFNFRHFDNYQEIKDELSQADIAFFTPNQMEKLPDNFVDIFVTISSLHEMRKEQIEKYLDMMQRMSSELIFIKQWIHWINPSDNITVTRQDFNLSKKWEILYDSQDPIQNLFFNLVAKKKN